MTPSFSGTRNPETDKMGDEIGATDLVTVYGLYTIHRRLSPFLTYLLTRPGTDGEVKVEYEGEGVSKVT